MNTYLDHATTSMPKAHGVVDAMSRALTDVCASPGRSAHRLGREASAMLDRARCLIAAFFGMTVADRVIFTSGATMALNLAIKGLLARGDHAVATCFDHSAVLRPLTALSRRDRRFTVVSASVPDGRFVDAVVREFRPETKLVVVNHASNVTGVVLPYAEILEAAHSRGVAVLLDAAQTAGCVPIDLTAVPVDLVAFSGHKALLGPQGVGCLLVNNGCLPLAPLIDGGTGAESDSLSPQASLPLSLEAGTHNLPGIAGLTAALEFAGSEAFREGWTTAGRLCADAWTRLAAIPSVRLHGRSGERPSVAILSFTIQGMLPERVARALDSRFGIQVRAGLHCAPLMHDMLQTSPFGTVRVAFGPGNTADCVDHLCDAVTQLAAGRAVS